MLSRLVPRRRGPRDEAGVVAIIVALTLSTVLLGFAALAVDLGSAYTRKADLQTVADELATAGASGLPQTSVALVKLEDARVALCRTHPLPGICDQGLPATWARDGDLTNGEVRFYGDAGQAGTFADVRAPAGLDPGDFLEYNNPEAAGIRVVLPPSRVNFGLASALGNSGVNVTQEATARIGTPLGEGILPFALTQDDIDAGQFCVTDTRITGDASPPGGAYGNVQTHWPGWPFLNPSPPTVEGSAGEQSVRLTLDVNAPVISPRFVGQVNWHLRDPRGQDQDVTGTPVSTSRSNKNWDVTLPEFPPGTSVYVWATGSWSAFLTRTTPFQSTPVRITYTGTASAPDDGLCSQAAAKGRGFIQLARPPGSGGLTENVRQGPATKLYDSTTPLGGQLLSSAFDCVSQVFGPSTACLSQNLFDSWSSRVSNGLLKSSGNTPGRLTSDCGNGTVGVLGGARVDASHLIDGTSSPFLTGTGKTPTALRTQITSGGEQAADGSDWAGVISSAAMRCPRLAVLPVIEPVSIAGVAFAQKIVKFTYVWIDEAGTSGPGRGLRFSNGGQLASVRGYVLEPGFFPDQVAGSPVVGPYLGDDMPKQVVLVRDLGADGT